ncbi:MAG: DEAD/DEAH box helicase family protein [Microcystis sp. M015S2]|uniref:EcoAI/FtnUII family type I restriction enzme subunit R n=1 Tax=unclassified Microcystis TaxID=2643300 RepID=UPI002587A0E0|nr:MULTISPECIES: type I restriction endonuclease subunit R [unclassified Microcystis]MCA2708376.1 DEAD/DEAH box helicase family protein [Microcystis sp. M025S2]MCA2741579.1 DEAD/DEAH box helicase family protein [Microcystis sp. M015S2]MCA2759042.1 DEAD/DEAH box helicase family protein [Microcystis sp. M145S2]
MNEAETKAELIDPALKAAGWGVIPDSKIRREVIAPGRLVGYGQRSSSKTCDYVLVYRGHKLATLEAKKRDAHPTEGLGQAKDYAERLQTPFALCTNGLRIYQVDTRAGKEGYIDRYPTPEELWAATYPDSNHWRDRFATVPPDNKSGMREARYYQHNAIQAVLEAIASGQKRMLLTMATGTGKTTIALQIAWKLFHSSWNLSGEPTHRPCILFLTDRNILANQALTEFTAFPEDALVRIEPKEIQKTKKVPKNGSVFFSIFQTFMTQNGEELAPNFLEYAPDFFDLVIVDECHRGGANDESTWRKILEYFAPAVQLGLTATPKRDLNGDTYKYFGEPLYTYSLKEGINEGYLTPFKVVEFTTNLDEYQYDPDDELIEGDIDENKVYTESDFNRIIEIEERERQRVKIFMEAIDQNEKTLVFCANQDHALAIRDLINQMAISSDPNYCARVTANDGSLGETHLKKFQDNEKRLPTILTTSRKLSTGVDARNLRNIVLLRPVKSMIEFKQIIGRGTRLFDNKDYFTIYDFVKAHENFNDPEWDGEPQEPVVIDPRPRPEPPDAIEDPLDEPDPLPIRQKIKIKLADGKERELEHIQRTTFWNADGKPISAEEFIQQLFGDIPDLFQDEAELRHLWGRPDTRKSLLTGLAEKGYGEEQLQAIARITNTENSDIYDVLTYIAYAARPLTREERVIKHKDLIFSKYTRKQREFLDFILDQYIRSGVGELDREKLPKLIEIKYHTINEAISQLGQIQEISGVFTSFQAYLYLEDAA